MEINKEIIERIYNNCFATITLENIKRQDLWERAYMNLGEALKKIIGE